MPAATENWLAPAGEHPFELTGYYGNRIFDEVFKSTFGGRCEKGKRFNTFDARVCKP